MTTKEDGTLQKKRSTSVQMLFSNVEPGDVTIQQFDEHIQNTLLLQERVPSADRYNYKTNAVAFFTKQVPAFTVGIALAVVGLQHAKGIKNVYALPSLREMIHLQLAYADVPAYNQSSYAPGYVQSSYGPGYSQSSYGPGYSQSSYGGPGYSQGSYAGYSQGSYGPGYSQSSYGPGYAQGSYASWASGIPGAIPCSNGNTTIPSPFGDIRVNLAGDIVSVNGNPIPGSYSQSSYSKYTQGTYGSSCASCYSQSSYGSSCASCYSQRSYSKYSQGSYGSSCASCYSQGSYGSSCSSCYSQGGYSSYSQGSYGSSCSSCYSQGGYSKYSQGSYGSSCSSCYSQGSYACFTADQAVLTPEGVTQISQVTVGMKVISYDEEKETFVTSVVGDVIVHTKENNPADFSRTPLLKVTTKIGSETKETLVTSNHPYFNPSTKTYKEIGEFKVGDILTSREGDTVISAIETVIDGSSKYPKQFVVVYSLHMSKGPANYLVNDIVVHNKI